MKGELIKLTYQVQLQPGEKFTLPESLVESVGAGDWSITIEKINPISESIRNHDAFLNSYAPEDEGLYDDYPVG
ncbi:MAG TPA: hypothetical protein DDW76_06145 [Cyanobacteria bacterium UBA11369]|nr:hypothetical protein [Cyanobacteria bacterium UBA11371]HBE29771.1 hypothetical protein [Cyanobacteria bacterium UBA11368]HBE48386.1 hypothetical protein [Cyanobacteria bacterium UBA11369]